MIRSDNKDIGIRCHVETIASAALTKGAEEESNDAKAAYAIIKETNCGCRRPARLDFTAKCTEKCAVENEFLIGGKSGRKLGSVLRSLCWHAVFRIGHHRLAE
jgi:hypothetical protein